MSESNETAAPPPSPPPAPPGPGNAMNDARPDGFKSEDGTLALITHLSGIFAGFIVPLVIWLIHKDNPAKGFLTDQAKEALNFQITVFLAWMVAFVSSFVLIGFLLYPVILIGNLVLCILAGVKANEGQRYRYPVSIRLIN